MTKLDMFNRTTIEWCIDDELEINPQGSILKESKVEVQLDKQAHCRY